MRAGRPSSSWGRAVRTLRHGIGDSPEFDPLELARFADASGGAGLECHRADLPILHPSGSVRRLKAPIEEIVTGGSDPPWWVMIGGLAEHSRYGSTASEAAAPVEGTCCAAEGGSVAGLVSVFLSSPGSVVPAHVDEQHNTLFQIAGSKTVVVALPAANEGLEQEIERCVVSGVRNLRSLPDIVTTYELGPGDGLYLPPCTPHWVLGNDGVSVSLSRAWATAWSAEEHLVRTWNARVRRVGLRPRAPRPGHPADRIKASCVRARSHVPARRRPR